jgi:hypothetical protein
MTSTNAQLLMQLQKRHAKRIRLAIQWLRAQEHQRFFLLQQNEASVGPTSCRAPDSFFTPIPCGTS